jgi:hypothetical protein
MQWNFFKRTKSSYILIGDSQITLDLPNNKILDTSSLRKNSRLKKFSLHCNHPLCLLGGWINFLTPPHLKDQTLPRIHTFYPQIICTDTWLHWTKVKKGLPALNFRHGGSFSQQSPELEDINCSSISSNSDFSNSTNRSSKNSLSSSE